MTRSRRGFTLVEMLVVIAIIMILAGILMPMLEVAQRKGREAYCTNNLRQIHIGWKAYMINEEYHLPPGALRLLTKSGGGAENFIDNSKVFLCKEDQYRGAHGGKPPSSQFQYAETDEPNCSYLYELSSVDMANQSIWQDLLGDPNNNYESPPDIADVDIDGSGVVSWYEFKEYQRRYGDVHWPHKNGYPTTKFPIVRCFWHAKDPDDNLRPVVLNLAWDGNVFRSSAQWEDRVLD